jgi:hypothetical protein
LNEQYIKYLEAHRQVAPGRACIIDSEEVNPLKPSEHETEMDHADADSSEASNRTPFWNAFSSNDMAKRSLYATVAKILPLERQLAPVSGGFGLAGYFHRPLNSPPSGFF